MKLIKKKRKIEDSSAIEKKDVDFFTEHYTNVLNAIEKDQLSNTGQPPLINPIQINLEGLAGVRYENRCLVRNCDEISNEKSFTDVVTKLIGSLTGAGRQELTHEQRSILQILTKYVDLYAIDLNVEYEIPCCIHLLYHIVRTRNLVISNNLDLTAKREEGILSETDIENARDQGFARPKVLYLCPMRKDALRIVKTLRDLMFGGSAKPFVSNWNRFEEEFGGDECAISEKRNVDIEFRELMTGNTDDCFRIGVGIAKKCLKLYTSFVNSDIIIASPLGLRTVVSANSEGDDAFKERDFLASIEILVIEKAEIILMQNWEHILYIIDNLHCQPKEIKTDISRVRHWSINQESKFYRQTVLLSSFYLPEFHAVLKQKCFNFAGSVSVVPQSIGYLNSVEVMVCQELQRVSVEDPSNQSDQRFIHFKEKVLPKCEMGTLIFIPSYYDFVRLRNLLKNDNESFVQLNEYSAKGKVAKARDLFFKGEKKLMLITERFHFFRRYIIKGAKSLMFYQPPATPKFYHEITNMLVANAGRSHVLSRMIYTKFDAIRVNNIFGEIFCKRLMRSSKNTHILLSE